MSFAYICLFKVRHGCMCCLVPQYHSLTNILWSNFYIFTYSNYLNYLTTITFSNYEFISLSVHNPTVGHSSNYRTLH